MKKIHLLFIFLLIQAIRLDAQSTLSFTNLAEMNPYQGAISAASDTNYIYVSNGFSPSGSFIKTIVRYDLHKNSWEPFTNSLVGKIFASSALIKGKLYIVNGWLQLNFANPKTEVVDLKTGVVRFSTDNPAPAWLSGAATWNGFLYVFGGQKDSVTYSNSLYRFDPSVGVWTKLANMPQAKQTKGEIIDGKLYTLGGYYGKPTDSIYVYDISKNEWSFLGRLPQKTSAHATAAYGSKIYLVGDFTNQAFTASYDVLTNTCTTYTSNLIERRHAGARIVNGRLYVMGGQTAGLLKSCLSILQVADLPSPPTKNK